MTREYLLARRDRRSVARSARSKGFPLPIRRNLLPIHIAVKTNFALAGQSVPFGPLLNSWIGRLTEHLCKNPECLTPFRRFLRFAFISGFFYMRLHLKVSTLMVGIKNGRSSLLRKNSLCQTPVLTVLIDAGGPPPPSPSFVGVVPPIVERSDFYPDDSARTDKPCLGTP